MYEIKPLEDDWKQYKSKKRRPFYLVIIILFIFFIISIFFFFSTPTDRMIFNNISTHIDKFSKSSGVENSTKSLNMILINGSLEKLEVYESIQVLDDKSIDPSSDLLVDIPILDVHESSKMSDSVSRKKGKVFLDIVETNSVTAYEDVERRFKQSADIDDALFLAKSYYKKGNYEKSEYWAFETNKLNSSLEESFFIFVKSKSKLGNNNEAISILNSYLKRTNSLEAKTLLNQLKNGRI